MFVETLEKPKIAPTPPIWHMVQITGLLGFLIDDPTVEHYWSKNLLWQGISWEGPHRFVWGARQHIYTSGLTFFLTNQIHIVSVRLTGVQLIRNAFQTGRKTHRAGKIWVAGSVWGSQFNACVTVRNTHQIGPIVIISAHKDWHPCKSRHWALRNQTFATVHLRRSHCHDGWQMLQYSYQKMITNFW